MDGELRAHQSYLIIQPYLLYAARTACPDLAPVRPDVLLALLDLFAATAHSWTESSCLHSSHCWLRELTAQAVTTESHSACDHVKEHESGPRLIIGLQHRMPATAPCAASH